MRIRFGLLFAVIVVLLTRDSGAQSAQPPLAALKAAAEQGDAHAQDKLGDVYRSNLDESSTLIWYRKAAEQGWCIRKVNWGEF